MAYGELPPSSTLSSICFRRLKFSYCIMLFLVGMKGDADGGDYEDSGLSSFFSGVAAESCLSEATLAFKALEISKRFSAIII